MDTASGHRGFSQNSHSDGASSTGNGADMGIHETEVLEASENRY